MDPASTRLYACLVGECSRADVAWTQILAGIQALCPELNNPDCHWLASGEVFLRVITCNLNMIKHDYSCNLRHKTLHLCACYHTLSAFLSFHANLCYNLKIH